MIDSTKLRPNGFAPGENTGGIGVLAGTHRLTASIPDVKPAEITLTFQANTATTIIAFTKSVLDPITRKPVEQLQFFSQSDPPREKGKHFYIVYASAHPAVDLLINGQSRNVVALRTLRADDIAGGAIKIEYAGKSIADFTAHESGTFLVIILDKADGTVAGMVLPDYG
jgi:hypothetical protein